LLDQLKLTIATETKAKLPPSKHEFAEVIHRLEAGGQCYPTLQKIMQIIGIYKAYAVPMDFYWRNLLYIAERVFFRSVSFLQILQRVSRSA